MNPIRLAAVGTVTLALLLYAIGIVSEQRARRATGAVRAFLSFGVGCDVAATALMVVATGSFAATLHGVLGYSALALMFLDTALLWRHWAVHRLAEVPRALHLYSRFAFLYWVLAYLTGAGLVMSAKRSHAESAPPAAVATAAATSAAPRIVSVEVGGMVCEACVANVGKELGAVPGVRRVTPEAAAQRFRVVCDAAVADTSLTAAVRRAGPQYLGMIAP